MQNGRKAMIRDLELIKNISLLYERRVFVWGCGYVGKAVMAGLGRAGVKVEAACDRNERLQGTGYSGIPILEPERWQGLLGADCVILIAVRSGTTEEILAELDRLKIPCEYVFTPFGLKWAFYYHIDRLPMAEAEKQYWKDLWEFQKLDIHATWLYHPVIEEEIRGIIELMQGHISTIVYSPPKVGSMSVEYSLNQAGIPNVHTHHLSWCEGLMPEAVREAFKRHIGHMRQANRKLRLITMVREPVSRDMSDFFEKVEEELPLVQGLMTGDWYQSFARTAERYFTGTERKKPENEMEHFLERMFPQGRDGAEFEWFNREIKEMFGIDVYQVPFDQEKGYGLLSSGNVDLLIMQTEKLNSLGQVVADFTGCPGFRMVHGHSASESSYRHAYREFLHHVRLSRSYVDAYYQDNPSFEYFYSEEDRKSFLERYQSRIAESEAEERTEI